MSDTTKKFLEAIDAFLGKHEMTPTRFGSEAVNDPNFVFSVRGGRSPSINTMDKVNSFMLSYSQVTDIAPTGEAA